MSKTGTLGNLPEQKLAGTAKQATLGGSEAALKLGETPLDKGLGVYEVAEGTTIEEMKPIFFDKNALVLPNYKLYQLNSKGKRFYYFLDEEGNPFFMPSVTTILSAVMPENKFLTDWKLSMGKEKAEAYTAERAAYGTFMHGCYEQLIVNRTYDLDKLREELAKYIERNELPAGFIVHAEDLKKDILAFAQWIRDYDVKPIAVEVSLYHPELGYAGMVDLVASVRKYTMLEELKARDKAQCRFNTECGKIDEAWEKACKKADAAFEKAVAKAKDDLTKIGAARMECDRAKSEAEDTYRTTKAQLVEYYNETFSEIGRVYGERLTGIVDFKSGRKGFYEEHQHQLNMYQLMWNVNYPEYPIDFIANFSPKDWRNTPSYNYKDQSDGQPLEKTLLFVNLFNIENNITDKMITVVSGTIDLNSDTDLDANIENISLEELVKNRNQHAEEEPNKEAEEFFAEQEAEAVRQGVR